MSIKRLLCRILGHKWTATVEITYWNGLETRNWEETCARCGRKMRHRWIEADPHPVKEILFTKPMDEEW